MNTEIDSRFVNPKTLNSRFLDRVGILKDNN